MKRRYAALAMNLAVASITFAQAGPPARQSPAPPAGTIEVSEDRPVNIGSADLVSVEPHLAAHPQNPRHLVAGVILAPKERADLNESSCAALTSFDAGQSWSRHDFPLKQCTDPWVAVRRDGTAVFLALAEFSELVAFRSADGGRTWGDRPVSLGKNHDHGTLAVDLTEGPFAGSVYAASMQVFRTAAKNNRFVVFVARSSDGGATFGEPRRLEPSNLMQNAMNPVVLSDGTLVVPFSDYRRNTPDGRTALLATGRDWVVTSADGGKSFSAPLFVSEACAESFPELAADASGGPFRDRLYWVCTDGRYERVYLHTSADRGERWSDPLVVNQGSGRRPYVRNAVVAVNGGGVVGVSWYDARNGGRTYRGIYRCQDVFFTASLDGGRSFLPEVKVSSGSNCPDTTANGEAGRRWPGGGDYHGLEATADGRFQVLWADSRSGIYQLRTATIKVNAGVTNER